MILVLLASGGLRSDRGADTGGIPTGRETGCTDGCTSSHTQTGVAGVSESGTCVTV